VNNMTLGDLFAHGVFPLVFLLWAELRFLPLVRGAIGWSKAHAVRSGVTAEQAQKHAPPI
jgi:hypothetical protein